MACLGRMATTGETVDALCMPPAIRDMIEADPCLVDAHRPRIDAYRQVCRALRPVFRKGSLA
jgi:xylulokinase